MGFSLDTSSKRFRQQQDIPFFQELDRLGKPTGKPMTYNSALYALKADIRHYFPDLDPADYGTHSFRRFGATFAHMKGLPNDLVQYMGRWVSDCFQRYFLFSDDYKVDISKQMMT
jgi:hypothetical protein